MTVGTVLPEYPPATFTERGLDLLFPPLCVGCRRIGRWFCSRCWITIEWTAQRRCRACGRPWAERLCFDCAGQSSALDGLIAVAEFDGVAREAIHALKFYGRHAIAGPLGRIMAQTVEGMIVDVVCPVPLHPKRRRERGYDQAALLTRSVARSLNLSDRQDALARVRRTAQQASLDRIARQANVEGAFRAWDGMGGRRVLLVDDVATTGATLNAAATAAREAGAAQVIGLVFAHGSVGRQPAGP